MTITREQVADLRRGDVVELLCVTDWNIKVRAELRPFASAADSYGLTLGPGLVLRRADGGVAAMWMDAHYSLVVISRAPRPLYVNSDHLEPKNRDIVVDRDGDAWQRRGNRWFLAQVGGCGVSDISDCAPLTLIGNAAGQVVP